MLALASAAALIATGAFAQVPEQDRQPAGVAGSPGEDGVSSTRTRVRGVV
jgi:hypothetical protein